MDKRSNFAQKRFSVKCLREKTVTIGFDSNDVL